MPTRSTRPRAETSTRRAPAQGAAPASTRADDAPHRRVDLRAIVRLAIPLFVNASLQAVLNLTDTWFLGRLSTTAVAAVGAVYWLVLAALLVFGGIGMGVQAFAAQAYGARRFRRASHAAWIGLWGAAVTLPVFLALALADRWLLPALRLDPEVARLAGEYWGPRLAGGALGVGETAVLSFFMGIGRVRTALAINAATLVVNAVGNEVLMFRLGWGVAGSAWATTIALGVGLAIALAVFLSGPLRERYAPQRTWRFRAASARRQFTVGLGVGCSIAFDILGLALFQLIVTQLGPSAGAASQIVMMLTSLAYMPAVGIGMAGTTLVGQAIGAGERDWAFRQGNATIAMSMLYMGTVGIVLASAGPWLVPWFVPSGDAHAGEVAALATRLLWIAAIYQTMDGMNIGSGFCLRAAGDTRVPAVLLGVLSFGVFVPLAHTFAFAAGSGWLQDAPGMGWGAPGAWTAAVVYVVLLGGTLFARWRSRAWQSIRLG